MTPNQMLPSQLCLPIVIHREVISVTNLISSIATFDDYFNSAFRTINVGETTLRRKACTQKKVMSAASL